MNVDPYPKHCLTYGTYLVLCNAAFVKILASILLTNKWSSHQSAIYPTCEDSLRIYPHFGIGVCAATGRYGRYRYLPI